MQPQPLNQVKSFEWPPLLFALATMVLFFAACFSSGGESTVSRASDKLFRVVNVAEGLEQPWSLAFLPGGDMLVTEKPGRLRRISGGALVPEPLEGVPVIAEKGQGGLLDVIVHPKFESNRLVYLSYSAAGENGYGTEVARGVLGAAGLEDVEVIFRALPKSGGGRHFGSRLLFDDEGYLFVTLGDRGNRINSQDLATHPGSVLRLNDDGSVPKDNPFVGKLGLRPEIFSFGHRNPQGIARDQTSGRIWIHEHGPQGGDEVNVITRGGNYGWPVVTHGEEYGGGEIGEGTKKEGMVNPAWVWVPSIAPSGLTFYSGDRFPHWKGRLLGGALKAQLVVSLELDNARVVQEERFLGSELGRIRDVRQGPAGNIYLLTDAGDGRVVRLEPLE